MFALSFYTILESFELFRADIAVFSVCSQRRIRSDGRTYFFIDFSFIHFIFIYIYISLICDDTLHGAYCAPK